MTREKENNHDHVKVKAQKLEPELNVSGNIENKGLGEIEMGTNLRMRSNDNHGGN